MKKYGRWIVFGLVAVGLVTLLLLVGTNKKLRQRIQSLLLERLIKNKVSDLKEKAASAKARAESGKMDAEKAVAIAAESKKAINAHKKDLQTKLKNRGLSTDEISDRFNNLNI